MTELTRVFYTQVKIVEGEMRPVEKELSFVKWTPNYLAVEYPENSARSGMVWAMGRNLVKKWLQEKVLRIEGDIPEWALIV
jgi:hypothetical protein